MAHFVCHPSHDELLTKGGLYADMWMKQQQAQDTDSSSDTEAKDHTSEKLQPPSASAGHHHWLFPSALTVLLNIQT